MMYPRLLVAKDLMSSDGCIFIHIDDKEFPNLRKICNDIFGEQNFVGTFIWRKKKEVAKLVNIFLLNTSTLLCTVNLNHSPWNDEEIQASEDDYNKEDLNGKFKAVKLAKWGNTPRKGR